MAMQVQLNISQYTQTNKHCRGKPINNYKAYSGAVNRLKSLRFNAILGDLRRFKKKFKILGIAI
jgi:hypothetical protein